MKKTLLSYCAKHIETDVSDVEIKVNPLYGNLRQLQAQMAPICFLNGAEGSYKYLKSCLSDIKADLRLRWSHVTIDLMHSYRHTTNCQ